MSKRYIKPQCPDCGEDLRSDVRSNEYCNFCSYETPKGKTLFGSEHAYKQSAKFRK